MTITDLEKKLSTAPFHVVGPMFHKIYRGLGIRTDITFVDSDNGRIADDEQYPDGAICCSISLDDNEIVGITDKDNQYLTPDRKDVVLAQIQLLGEKITDIEPNNN